LIGFAGAPWTLAAYMIEGGSAADFHNARAFALEQPEAFARLIDLLSRAVVDHLAAQIDAGADVVQLFDSWAGVLPEPEFARWCEAPATRIAGMLKERYPEVPIIAFPRGAGVMYRRYVIAVPVDAVSLDSGIPLAWAREAMPGVCLQGNLDPAALLAGGEVACREARRIVGALGDRPFVFNLGHGVLPQTDPDAVGALVEYVKSVRLPQSIRS
jgi:uroporphyrinogen decarboxylase